MAVTEQALKTDNASRKTGNTTKNEKRERAVRTRDGGKTARKGGAERLQEAADRRVGRNSEKLADLLEEALEGKPGQHEGAGDAGGGQEAGSRAGGWPATVQFC
jgi:hypothetical protein